MGYLYKYKTTMFENIENLIIDSLWVSDLNNMNDPMELPIYCEDENVDEEEIDKYKNWILKDYYCISLSKTPYNKRLWSYYTGTFDGMVLAYNESAIEEALKENNCYFKKGKVIYDGKKIKVTKKDMQDPDFIEKHPDVFFHKTIDWEAEEEFRFIINKKKSSVYEVDEKGFILSRLIPHHMFIGYKANTDDKEAIKYYCKSRGTSLYELKPNDRSRDCKDYNKKVLVSRKGKEDKTGVVYTAHLG